MHYITSGLTTNPAHEEKGLLEEEPIFRKEDDFDKFVQSISNDPLLSSIRSPRSYEEEVVLQDQLLPGYLEEPSALLV